MKEFGYRIPASLIEAHNAERLDELQRDRDVLAEKLAPGGRLEALGTDVDGLVERLADFTVAVPSWGLATGGTRFGRFPGRGEPEDIFQKLVDAATVHQLCGGAPRVSLHLPWDRVDDPRELADFAGALGLSFDAMNSNTFQDQPGQKLSYKFGSLSHTDSAVRRQAIAHNLEVAAFGEQVGSRALTVWIGDGGSFPGQIHLRRSLERAVASLQEVYAGLPPGWRLFTEHKPYEPAFYSTVIQDWGTSLMICEQLGDRAQALVDLGHHLPGTNIEMVVARLIQAGKLGGFHLNDSKYGDDDLTAGSIHPYQLFLIFNELVDAELDPAVDAARFDPAYMIDQSHNLKDPIEALITTVEETRQARVKALLVDRAALDAHQESNDVLLAERTLREAFDTDVRPLLALARHRRGAAIEPLAAYRASKYRERKSAERKADRHFSGGIV